MKSQTLKLVKSVIGQSAIIVGLAATSALSIAVDIHSSEFTEAYNYYQQVSNDRGGNASKALKKWEPMLQNEPSDAFLKVMHGSTLTLKGRDAWMPWSKLRFTEQGLAEMTQAQALLTEADKQLQFEGMSIDLHVKTTAGITFTQVPEFFGYLEEGFYLLTDVLTDAEFMQLPNPHQTFVYYYAIQAAYQLGRIEEAKSLQEELEWLQVNDEFTQQALLMGVGS